MAFNHRLGNDNAIEAIQWRDAGRKWELMEMTIDMLRTRLMPKEKNLRFTEKDRAILIDTLQTLWMKPDHKKMNS